ncbi:MAG: CHAD domain-containing protein [Acidobacteria bacterium]|nr:CHAD domain-containing protein [Acidobacteriota bacterium]
MKLYRWRADPNQPAAPVLREILQELLAAIRANEDGVRRNRGWKCLHDFRVAVRRTRSALGQIRRVLPKASRHHFRQEFSWLARSASRARDLDVQRLAVVAYIAGQTETGAHGLQLFEAHLTRERARAQTELLDVLRSPRCALLMTHWKEFLRDLPAGGGADARRPIVEVAGLSMSRAHRRVLAVGAKIGPYAPAAGLHRLRIACKKLRYLMEFFGGLYSGDEVGEGIRTLEDLQDSLGDFNDYAVQRSLLQGYLQATAAASSGAAGGETALRKLEQHLLAAQEKERLSFGQFFDDFSAADRQASFWRLFSQSPEST